MQKTFCIISERRPCKLYLQGPLANIAHQHESYRDGSEYTGAVAFKFLYCVAASSKRPTTALSFVRSIFAVGAT